jgi:tetratricopeptide (TPR) repeat protein
MPAGLLLVAGNGTDAARESLLAGRLPLEWPAALEGHRLAHAGLIDEAIAVFAASDDPVSRYNLFVLDPEAITRAEVAAGLDAEWKPLVDHVAYTLGLTSVTPVTTGPDDELAALILTARAAAAIDEGDEEVVVALLERAAAAALDTNPAFAGVILSELAGRAHSLEAAEASVGLLKGTDLKVAYAEALYQRAGHIHGLAIEGRRPLSEAITGYTEALKYLNETDNAPLFARVHMNLGIAYLAAPLVSANDHLRAGIAVQSLRTAARLLDPKTDSEEWASATLNLANSLVYAPSTHQRDNLMEAVDLYETVIRLRSAKKDPLGRARVLANQGNALAHLGLIDDSRARLSEAQFLFASKGDSDSAAMVGELMAELASAAS